MKLLRSPARALLCVARCPVENLGAIPNDAPICAGEMQGTYVNWDDGGRYNPVANTWIRIGGTGYPPPSPREYHSAVWTGSEMIIWGGFGGGQFDDGGRYDPVLNRWQPIAPTFWCSIFTKVPGHCRLVRNRNDCLGWILQRKYVAGWRPLQSCYRHVDVNHDQWRPFLSRSAHRCVDGNKHDRLGWVWHQLLQ